MHDLKKITDLAKKRGFVYQGSEIYGGLSNTWDYGPLGTLLKSNIENLWKRDFVRRRSDVVAMDSSIIMNPNVWVASGHAEAFADPLTECKDCHSRFRVDKLVEEYVDGVKNALSVDYQLVGTDDELRKVISEFPFILPNNWAGDKTPVSDLDAYLKSSDCPLFCPNCFDNGHRVVKNFSNVQQFNLMLSTRLGTVGDSSVETYLRPETAQGIFVNFANVARTSRKKLPFGIAQVGKAFRNEITPRNFIFRTREFEQMEIEYFCEPGTDAEHFEKWMEREYAFFTKTLGLKKDSVRFVPIEKAALPHYCKEAGDFEYAFPFGWGEISTLANRTDYDLLRHMELSKADLTYFDTVNNRKFVPYVIEPSMGLSRLVLATMCDAYDEVVSEEGNSRVIMRFNVETAPIKVAVLPVVKKNSEKAKDVFDMISREFDAEYDETGSVGKRFYSMDEIGVPFCVTVDDGDSVRIRDRDSGEQIEVSLYDLIPTLREMLHYT